MPKRSKRGVHYPRSALDEYEQRAVKFARADSTPARIRSFQRYIIAPGRDAEFKFTYPSVGKSDAFPGCNFMSVARR
jgi:hypothetical protein